MNNSIEKIQKHILKARREQNLYKNSITPSSNRNQCLDDDDKQDSNLLVVPIANMPRTPGGETCQVS